MLKTAQILYKEIILIVFIAFTAMQAQSADSGNPGQLVSQLESDLATALINQVNVLSPSFYKDAQSELIKAKQGLEKGAKISAIVQYVTKGNDNLKKAEEIAQVSRTILRDTNEARGRALKASADELGETFYKVEKDYLRLTLAIERDNLSYAQENAAKVKAAFMDVEIMAIKNNALGNARKMMDNAERAKIQKIVPTAYNDALRALNDADAFIGKNPYSSEAINQRVAHAEFMAQRMMAISESSKDFKEMTPEVSALYVESMFLRLSETMDTGDLRNQSFEAQVTSLSDAIQEIVRESQSVGKENQECRAQIADLEQQLAGLKGYSREQEAARQKLADEREFNEKFITVQGYFHPDEAEVYSQGKQLVIRMRGIQFPVGQAILTPDNYSLLSKVQRAIQTFGQPLVTIEGHTDSTGSPQANQELSQERAEAVKAYLIANKTLPEDRIRATGYGPDRPLAPETTPEGRAINRRIDVLIQPVAAR